MSLQVWIPLVGTNTDNQGLLPTTKSKIGTVTENSGEGLLGPGTRIGSQASDSASRIRFTSPFILSESLGLDQTFMAWVYPEGDHSNYCGTIVSSGNWNGNTSWTFSIGKANGHVYGARRYSTTGIACSVPTGSWTHLAVVRDGTTGISTYYKNGVYVGTQSLLSGSLESSNSQSFSVGLAEYANWCPFNGRIQDLRIYDEKLSVRQIQEIAKGLAIHYPLNDSVAVPGGLVYDCSGYGKHATLSSIPPTPQTESVRRSRSWFYKNADNFFTASIVLPSNRESISVSYWFKSSNAGTGSYHQPFNIGSSVIECSIYTGLSGRPRWGLVLNGTRQVLDTGSGVQDGKWHNVVGTYNGTTMSTYIDGVLQGSKAVTGSLASGSRVLRSGRFDNSVSYANNNANLSDIRVYATALTPEQVKELYNNPISVCKGGTLMCYEITE